MVGKPALHEPTVSIQKIKDWAARTLDTSSILRRMLETEPDTLPAAEFVVKAGLWLRILEFKGGERDDLH